LSDTVETLDTARGPVVLRPERPDDQPFLYALFRSRAPAELLLMPVDDATKESLLRMQFTSQTATYRAQYPKARFDIIEAEGVPIGRIVFDAGTTVSVIVDLVLVPERRGGGWGGAIIDSLLERVAPLGRPVRIQVLFNNEPSLRLFKRRGFVETGQDLPYLALEWRPPEV
jgi:RimJ/RimL family protein N-acetyltransferase